MIELLPLIIASFSLAIIVGPLGSFMIWNRQAFLPDVVAHASLFGAALAIIFGFAPEIGAIVIAILICLIVNIKPSHLLPRDLLLATISQLGIAGGVIIIAIFNQRLNLDPHDAHDTDDTHAHDAFDPHIMEDLLFGNAQSITLNSSLMVAIICITSLLIFLFLWRKIILISIDQDIAITEGVNPKILYLIIAFMQAITIGFSIRVMGILLVSALFLLPAFSARMFSSTPTQSALFATIIAIAAISLGIMLSTIFDIEISALIASITALITIIIVFFRYCYSALNRA